MYILVIYFRAWYDGCGQENVRIFPGSALTCKLSSDGGKVIGTEYLDITSRDRFKKRVLRGCS